MKSLLHSKKFRTNLYKWLFIYVGVMLLLTTVITYSRYMTSLQVADEARVTKYNVTIAPVGCKIISEVNNEDQTIKKTCDAGAYLESNKIEYYFSVDTTELEATSTFALTFKTNDKIPYFDIEKIEIVNSDLTSKIPEEIVCKEACNTKTIINNIEARQGKITYYAVTVNYKGNSSLTDDEKLKEQVYSDIVSIGYSATQVTK